MGEREREREKRVCHVPTTELSWGYDSAPEVTILAL